MKRIKKLCKDNDILFIADEVQTGFGRTGADFAYQLFNVKPDIIVKGGDYRKQDVVGNDLAKIEIVDFAKGYSTTSVLEKM